MRGFRRVRWVFAILAFFWGALFLYAALAQFAADQVSEQIVAGVIGLLACAVGYFLAPGTQEPPAP